MKYAHDKHIPVEERRKLAIESLASEVLVVEFAKSKGISNTRLSNWRSDLLRGGYRLFNKVDLLNLVEALLLRNEVRLNIDAKKKYTLRWKVENLAKSRRHHVSYRKHLLAESQRFRRAGVIIYRGSNKRIGFSKTQKKNIIKLIESSPLNSRDALKIMGISEGTYGLWKSIATRQGIGALRSRDYDHKLKIPPEIIEIMLCVRSQYPYITAAGITDILVKNFNYWLNYRHVEKTLRNYIKITNKLPGKFPVPMPKIVHGNFVHDVWLSDFSTLPWLATGRNYFLSVMDDFSRYVIAWSVTKSQSTNTLINCIDNAVRSTEAYWPNPVNLIVDNGPAFKSAEFASYCANAGIRRHLTKPFFWLGKVRIERFHGTLKTALRAARPENETELTDFVQEFIDYYNEVRPHFGLEGRTPGEAYRQTTIMTSEQLANIKETTLLLRAKKLINQ